MRDFKKYYYLIISIIFVVIYILTAKYDSVFIIFTLLFIIEMITPKSKPITVNQQDKPKVTKTNIIKLFIETEMRPVISEMPDLNIWLDMNTTEATKLAMEGIGPWLVERLIQSWDLNLFTTECNTNQPRKIIEHLLTKYHKEENGIKF